MAKVAEAKELARKLRRQLRQLEAVPGIGSGDLREQEAMRKRRQRQTLKVVVVPACEDRERRERLEQDDEAWLRWYEHDLFWYDFTGQQREMISAIRNAILFGGDQALAASRGEGKTKIFERMLLKYTLAGIIDFSVLLSATGGMAENSLGSLRDTVERNDRLCADYPEVCVPVRALENTPNRAHYQLVSGVRHDNGEAYEMAPSKFTWCGHEIVFPNVPGSPSAGSIIATRGLDAAVRGLNKKNKRPKVVGIDDPDTEDTVRSIDQARKLEERIDRGIAGLGGQQRAVARVMLTTLQRAECVSAWYTDPKRKPSFKGKRFRFLIKPPDNLELWHEYVQLWREGLQTGDEFARAAHGFYLERRDAMDAGAEVANPHRFNPQELPDGTQLEVSSLQRYYNEVARTSQEAVSTEYDNDPRDETVVSSLLSAEKIAAKVSGYERGTVPSDATMLSAMIDVQGKLLYYAVCAWKPGFSGYVVDYGAWPKQGRNYFSLADAVPTIPDMYQGGLEASIFAALKTLEAELLGREWPVFGGGAMRVSRCLIDANWGESTDTVYSFCRQSQFASIIRPTHGRGITSKEKPILLWSKQEGEEAGLNWRVRRSAKRGFVRYGIYDTNFWKTFVHQRLAVSMGDPGSLALFRADPHVHRMLADHLHAEYPVERETPSSGRKVNEWQQRANHPDNHLLDCLVGCAVGASMLGASLAEHAKKPKPNRVPLSKMGRA